MISVAVTEVSQVAEARRRVAEAAASLGFGATATGRASIVVTELATNIVKYGGPGEILVSSYEDDTGSGLEILALDKGPGMANAAQAQRDGHSTGGSSGNGLGAARRQAETFDIASWPGRGTAIMARIVAIPGDASRREAAFPSFASVAVPLRGETVSGDIADVQRQAGGWTVLVADGLGHGPQAAEAAHAALVIFRRHAGEAPAAILAAIHAGLGHTRGGAVSVCRLDLEESVAEFAGIGNVAGAVVAGPHTTRLVSLAGTAGLVARSIRSFTYPFPPGSLLLMHSDGIGTGWSFDRYPGLAYAHPSLVAAVLYRDFTRVRDDATVLVARASAS